MISTTQAPLRTDQRPLYAQASEALKALVLRGSYAPGERLPSEVELSQHLGISRPTLREALRQLEKDGIIVRRHGVGTFVADRSQVIDAGLEVLESIETVAQRIGLQVRMGELTVQQVPSSDEYAAVLDAPPGMDLTRVSRAILVDNRPIAYLVDILPDDVLNSDDLRSGFTGSVLDLLLRRGTPRLLQSRTEIEAVRANAEVARALQIRRDDVVLHLVAQLYSASGRVVDYSLSYFVPGYFRFHVVRRVGETG